MHDVPFAASSLAAGIFRRVQHRHIGVMKPMMRWNRRIQSLRGWIRPPEIAQLLVDLWMIRIMRKGGETIDAVFIPSSDFVGNDRSFFERDPVDQRIDPCVRWGIREQLVGNSADDFMTGRAISK